MTIDHIRQVADGGRSTRFISPGKGSSENNLGKQKGCDIPCCKVWGIRRGMGLTEVEAPGYYRWNLSIIEGVSIFIID